MSRHKAIGFAVAAALVVAMAGVTPAAAENTREQPPGGLPGVVVPKLTWTDSGGGFQCTTAAVPLDYRNPRGRSINLAVTRKLATNPAKRIGVLLVNPGGPGGSGQGFARELATSGPAELRERFDIVGPDPRGVGASTPLACQSQADYAKAWTGTKALPTAGAFDRALGLAREFNAACQRASGDLLPYVGTEFVARDMDVLRAALGEQKISYFGVSFGTYIGTVFTNLFPTRGRAVALDGAYDPEHYANRPYLYDFPQYQVTERAIRKFFDWCKSAPQKCKFGNGNPEQAYKDLLASLDANPVKDANGNVVASAATLVLQLVFDVNGGTQGWARIGDGLAQAAATRNGRMLNPISAGRTTFLAANTAVECADRKYPRDINLLRLALKAETVTSPLAGPAMGYGPPGYDHSHATACVQWPAEQRSRYAGPFTAPRSAPVLVVGTTGDPDTPYIDAVALSKTLKNSRLLTFKGEGHAGFFTSKCTEVAITSYLVDRTLPPVGKVCDDDPPPPAT